ncbi:stromal membrane-associated protein 1 [Cylas formicarius]|uniref:stromal membrane-associated protein 1 n=1 Tax=Cylas formicarius TaxID=197179 RepID=UPI002958A894|nr:stromal membrane-associated protein 1 [Cylas formicarius]
MSLKSEKDKTKQLNEKCQSVLNALLRDEDNKYCVDCDSKGPRWASWNIGVFLCIRCAGIHRNLGVHISKVKSVNLDAWTPEQVVSLQQMGNSRARAVYEANLPDNFRRPQSDLNLESFIRAKYEHKKYIAREWVQPPLPKVNWEKEIEEEMEKQKRKKKTMLEKKPLANVEVPQLPKPTNPSPKPARSISSTPEVKEKKNNNDLLGIQNGEDSFSGFISASTTNNLTEDPKKDDGVGSKSEEESFFNQPMPAEKEKVKLDKDSILALYGSAPTIQQSSFAQFSNMVPQIPYAQTAPSSFSVPQNFQGYSVFPQGQQPLAFAGQNGVPSNQSQFGTNQWVTGTQQWNKPAAQFPAPNQVQMLPNQFPVNHLQNGQSSTQFPTAFPVTNTQVSMAQNQFAQPQFPQASGNSASFGQISNSFGSQTSGLPQQFSNLSLNNTATANMAPTLATNIWQ